jgi:hypothetical protein
MFAVSEGRRYTLDIVGGTKLVLGKWVGSTWTKLATAPYVFDPSRWYTLSVYLPGGAITAYVNGAPVLWVADSSFSTGAIGIESNDPFAFDNVVVTPLAATISPPPVSPTPALRP